MATPRKSLRHYHNKAHLLRARLRRLAYEYGAGTRLPPVIQMQETMGVSAATLWRACKQLEEEGILKTRRGVGIFVSAHLQPHLCFVCDSAFFLGAGTSPFWSMLLNHAYQGALAQNGAFSTHFAAPFGESDQPLHQGFIEEVMAGRVQGVFAVGIHSNAIKWIQGQDVPVVSFASPAQYQVRNSGEQVIIMGVENLVKRGCRRIAFFKPQAPFRSGDTPPIADVELFRTELKKYDLPFFPEMVSAGSTWEDFTPKLLETHQEQGYAAATRLFGPDSDVTPPDGILITDDTMAQGAFVALAGLNVELERDVKVTTHSNRGSVALLGYQEKLVRLEFDPEAVAQAMYTILNALMAGREPVEEQIVINPSLNVGSKVEQPEKLTIT